ncbi:MAG: cupredoxin domain-containing protein [Gemmatimonadaceae bacterium]
MDETLSGGDPAPALAAGEAAARRAAGANTPAAATANAAASATPGQIGIDNFSFTPKEATIARGGTVNWVNHDDVPHRIQSANDRFAPSTVLDTKGSYSVTLATPGEYPYFCTLHPTMTGKVVVR